MTPVRRVTQRKRTEHKLRKAVETVHYEFWMFYGWYQQWKTLENEGIPHTGEELQLRNALFESALLHARNLRDFFICHGREDDIVASDFLRQVPRWRLAKLRSKSTRNRMNRMLAHMSFKRSLHKRQWDIDAIASEIVTAWALFLSKLERESPKLRNWFRK